MEKKHYIKPAQQVIVLQHRTLLLQGSPTEEKPDAEEYGGEDAWLG